MDIPDYYFDDLGLLPDDFKPFPNDGDFLPICWIDDDGHFLCL